MTRSIPRRAALLLLLLGSACAPPSRESAPPEGGGTPTLSIEPRSGPPQAEVTLHARGFAPNLPVDVGFGPPRSEYDVIGQARTDAQGTLRTTVRVPAFAGRGETYVFVVAGPRSEPKAISEPFMVTEGGSGR